MPVPISQMCTVATYVLKQKLRGQKRYPFVLMLEPLFRCNLACAGCGKIQYPAHILKTELSPEECFQAVEECGTPMVSIPGGEPLMHSEIEKIVEGLVARKKYIYLCTNALLLKEKLRSEEHTSELQSRLHLVCRLLLEKKKARQLTSRLEVKYAPGTSRRQNCG